MFEETARKIQAEYETDDLDAVISHIIGWLEMSDPPSDLDYEQLDKFEDQIENWIDEFKSKQSESSRP